MTDLRKAAEMALEALKTIQSSCREGRTAHAENEAAIIEYILRQALAQPEQEWDSRHPKAQALIGDRARLRIELWLVERLLDDPHFETTSSDMEYWGPLHDKLKETLAQPEQEPVAWRNTETGEFCTGGFLLKDFAKWTPLYTAPPKKEWVGLTDEDKNSFWRADQMTSGEWDELFAAVEAKLKEKNSG